MVTEIQMRYRKGAKTRRRRKEKCTVLLRWRKLSCRRDTCRSSCDESYVCSLGRRISNLFSFGRVPEKLGAGLSAILLVPRTCPRNCGVPLPSLTRMSPSLCSPLSILNAIERHQSGGLTGPSDLSFSGINHPEMVIQQDEKYIRMSALQAARGFPSVPKPDTGLFFELLFFYISI